VSADRTLVRHAPRNRDVRDAVHARITRYQQAAAESCPSLTGKNLTPHTLRHSSVICTRFDRARYVSDVA
jgi:integrase